DGAIDDLAEGRHGVDSIAEGGSAHAIASTGDLHNDAVGHLRQVEERGNTGEALAAGEVDLYGLARGGGGDGGDSAGGREVDELDRGVGLAELHAQRHVDLFQVCGDLLPFVVRQTVQQPIASPSDQSLLTIGMYHFVLKSSDRMQRHSRRHPVENLDAL